MTAQSRHTSKQLAARRNIADASVTATTPVTGPATERPTRPAPPEAVSLLPDDGDYAEWDAEAFRRWIDAGGIQ